nr:AlpA family transcriptional regulator [uncultured Albidiferax sp.]
MQTGIYGENRHRPGKTNDTAQDRAVQLLQEALSLLLDGEPGLQPVLSGAEDRLIRLPEVLRLTGMCRSALYDQMARGQFPRSIKIGQRAASWSARAVHEWIARRVDESGSL